ncbi:hypothetical protein PoB_000515400 [Plakobranchus ocellatus]|uniref:Transposase n=1 Tax=Plakobranchus ocellatus TaxID=259542 RepID=A0AAV3Y8S4_9GAST|nr:hypothetical protein PoB_000515400 [Plakobranchus ocellatus]
MGKQQAIYKMVLNLQKKAPRNCFQLQEMQWALITKKDIFEWFEEMTKTIIKLIDSTIFLEPGRIYYCDESGFRLNTLRASSCLTWETISFIKLAARLRSHHSPCLPQGHRSCHMAYASLSRDAIRRLQATRSVSTIIHGQIKEWLDQSRCVL